MSELKPCQIDVMKVHKLCYDGALRAYVEDEYIYLKDTVSGEVVWIGDAPASRAQPDHIGDTNKMIAQPNVPLTIDDITDLDYEPIWIEDISGCNTSCWAIAGRQRSNGIELYDEHCGEHYIDFAAWDNYGKTWLAYRRKKEDV